MTAHADPDEDIRSDVVGLEKEGWHNLSSSGSRARDFYDRVLDDAVLMLLPGGLLLDDRSAILDSMAGQPWAHYSLESFSVLLPTPDVAVVAYGAQAQRQGQARYEAQVSSSYVRRADGWRLFLHQQTPR
jgi:hypothetical protein